MCPVSSVQCPVVWLKRERSKRSRGVGGGAGGGGAGGGGAGGGGAGGGGAASGGRRQQTGQTSSFWSISAFKYKLLCLVIG